MSPRFEPQIDKEFSDLELTPELCAELLDADSWGNILELYSRTMKLAVALVDPDGQLIGNCWNPQPIWSLARAAKPERGRGCLFCLDSAEHCTAAAEALRTNSPVLAHDSSGFAHTASPLFLGGRHLGTLLAGQVFDRYPEPIPLQRMARNFGLSAQQVWHTAGQQAPMTRANITTYGALLSTLGQAFLRERYGAILGRMFTETNRRFRLLVDDVKDYAIFTVDPTGIVNSWNIGAERLSGYTETEILGKNFSCLFNPEDIENGVPLKELEIATREGRAASERWHIRKDGSLFFVSGFITTLGNSQQSEFGMIMRDITDRYRAEIAWREAQKLESLGVLAGGIAHDFNNLLCGILGNASLLLDTMLQPEPNRLMLHNIVQSSMRAADLVKQLLAYAGKGRFVISRFNLSQLISEILPLIQTSIPAMVHLELVLKPDLPEIEADASQIQQLVMNLVINAAEAIGSKIGTVWVSTGVTEVVDLAGQKGPKKRIYLKVRDSGCGMDEATKSRIFEPFFTTKFLGRGLGLAALLGITRVHEGTIAVESALGKGSTFTVSFPALETKALQEKNTSLAPTVQGTGTILVAEDEVVVREFIQAALEHAGYVVLIAENGFDAVNIFKERAADIDLVILDRAMPVMDGEQALKCIRAIRPGICVLMTSGDSELEGYERFGCDTAFISKPYTVEQLAEKIQSILSNPGKPISNI